jgi:hypothetical protein
VTAERYVVLGLAQPRSAWFREVARWATAAALPVEFLKCVSVEEVRARLASGRVFSALLVDGSLSGFDRDLADSARAAGCAVLAVDDGRARRDWSALGVTALLPAELTRADLLDALGAHALPIARTEAAGVAAGETSAPATWRGSLVAVTGAAGAGASTTAMALAQGLAADPRYTGLVALADLALDADQAVLHDAGDVVPGLQELVDAHRAGLPGIEEVRGLTWSTGDRGYALVIGLRRHRDWAALRPRSVEAAIDGLRRAFRVVVADVEPDVEGEDQCGSSEVEDRNVLARTATARAQAVVVVGLPSAKGVHSLVRVVDGLLEHGVDPRSLVLVVNRAPRNPRARAEITRALADLTGGLRYATAIPSPVFLPERRRFDDLVRDGARLPASMCEPVTSAVATRLDRFPGTEPGTGHEDEGEPVAVVPGSLGAWSDDDEPE